MAAHDTAKSILEPGEEYERTQALRELLADLQKQPRQPLGPELREFLETYCADADTQSALIGLILYKLRGEHQPSIDIVARVFPALVMYWEPELRDAARDLLRTFGQSTGEAYAAISNVFGDPEASDVTTHYAYRVLSTIDPDKLPA